MISSKLYNKPILLYLLLLSILVVLTAFCSRLIVSQKHTLLIALPLLIIYFKLPFRLKIALLLLACLYPLSFGNVGPVPTFLWVEWMSPLVAGIMLYHIVSDRKHIFPEKCLPAISAIFVLIVWAAVNYMRHPVLAEKLMGASESAGGLRSYYTIFIGVSVFFVCMWFARYEAETGPFWNRFLTFLMYFSLFLGITRIFSHFFSFDIPFVFGVFRYAPELSFKTYGGEAYRIGGLSTTAIIGMAAFLALRIKASFSITDVILLICFALFLFLSGGRTATLGVLAAFSFYCFIMDFKGFGWISAGVLLFFLVVWLLISVDMLTGQINRLFSLEGGFRVQDKYRFLTFHLMWEQFLDSPFWGKGIGYFGKGMTDTKAFAFGQLKTGGHGSYISILCIFGLGGAYFFGIMLLSILANGVRLLKNKIVPIGFSAGQQMMTVFALFVIIVNSVGYIAGGNGYSDMTLYMLAGIMAGLYSKGRMEHEKM